MIFDGTGFGPDGTVWGGELLVGGLGGYERGAPVPGADAGRGRGGAGAVENGLHLARGGARGGTAGDPAGPRGRGRRAPVAGRLRSDLDRVASPLTTSAGRLFDAVAALCGLRAEVSHEGQAAAELEAAAAPAFSAQLSQGYPLAVIEDGEAPLLLDPRETIRAIVADLSAGVRTDAVSARFHAGLAAAVASACVRLADRHRIGLAVLGGGVFQNRLLLERIVALLGGAGLRVLLPLQLPPNDGAISFGQAAIGASPMRRPDERARRRRQRSRAARQGAGRAGLRR